MHLKNIYKLLDYPLSQEKCELHRKRFEESVRKWEKTKKEGCTNAFAAEFSGISRASYFRYKAKLLRLSKGIPLLTKRPKTLRKPLWGERINNSFSSSERKILPTGGLRFLLHAALTLAEIPRLWLLLSISGDKTVLPTFLKYYFNNDTYK